VRLGLDVLMWYEQYALHSCVCVDFSYINKRKGCCSCVCFIPSVSFACSHVLCIIRNSISFTPSHSRNETSVPLTPQSSLLRQMTLTRTRTPPSKSISNIRCITERTTSSTQIVSMEARIPSIVNSGSAVVLRDI
jgi:hypothetical protein